MAVDRLTSSCPMFQGAGGVRSGLVRYTVFVLGQFGSTTFALNPRFGFPWIRHRCRSFVQAIALTVFLIIVGVIRHFSQCFPQLSIDRYKMEGRKSS